MKCSLYNLAQTNRIVDRILYTAGLDISAAITPQGRELIRLKGWLQDGETLEERLARSCAAFSTGTEHAIRLAAYLSKGWFMFATPLLTNGGTDRGLPISCFLNSVDDSLESIAAHYSENIFLSTNGGGIGADWSPVRSAGTPTSRGSEASGPVACIKVADSQVPAFKQGVTRQGAYAAYLRVDHPEIWEYLTVRSNDGGNPARKSFNIHIGVALTNDFMEAVELGQKYSLVCPHTGKTIQTLDAREVWGEILKLRMTDRGEPYLFFVDRANEVSPYYNRDAIRGSNLCTEITLKTDSENTAVCCLSSVNVAKYPEWASSDSFIADMVMMLDNALTVFIRKAPKALKKAVHSARAERSIGLGMMGLHSYAQEGGVDFEEISGGFICKDILVKARAASKQLAKTLGTGESEESQHRGLRNLHLTAIAPNASSSLMLGVSPGVEPWNSNIYTIIQGSLMFEHKNPQLEQVIQNYVDSLDTEDYTTPEEIWEDIRQHGGSVQHLDWLTDQELGVFKTAVELDQYQLVLNARRRQVYVCQAQSINLFFRPDADPKYVNKVHMAAWRDEEGLEGVPLKSLYYLRVEVVSKVEHMSEAATREVAQCSLDNKDDCLACQG